MPADPDEFGDMLTAADAAKLLGVGVDTIRQHARAGRIPAHRPPGMRGYFIFKDELLAFIRAQPAQRPTEGLDDVAQSTRERR